MLEGGAHGVEFRTARTALGKHRSVEPFFEHEDRAEVCAVVVAVTKEICGRGWADGGGLGGLGDGRLIGLMLGREGGAVVEGLFGFVEEFLHDISLG